MLLFNSENHNFFKSLSNNAGKCLPIKRGAGIYQPHMNRALDVINGGEWVSCNFDLAWSALKTRAEVKTMILKSLSKLSEHTEV